MLKYSTKHTETSGNFAFVLICACYMYERKVIKDFGFFNRSIILLVNKNDLDPKTKNK